ncbi:type I secretion system permease/ATPase [Arenibaculum pallidiluteum]|uniref:type I secretion system permease/ATPase n=1 Tax=Arenibaculum pallidiluteum TaxID=2812559 RepID=UPI001A973566|nr:type I secretion system permease/ATPase [Arenibaculum pallidiluteum]
MRSGPDHPILRPTLRRIGGGLGLVAVFSGFVSILMLVVPLFTMQVYDRVMSSRSTDTLAMLAIVAVGGLALYGVLDFIRARILVISGTVLARRLNVPTLEAAIVDTLSGGRRNAAQAMRDLNDLRNFMTGSAVIVPMELAWCPVILAILFLLHPLYGGLALGAAALLLAVSVVTDQLTRRPMAAANEAAARSFADIASAIRHAEAIEAMGMLPALGRRWQRSQAGSSALLDDGSTTARALASASRSLRLMLQVAIISTGAILVLNHEASPGSMMASGILIGRLLQPIEQLVDGWRQWVFAISAFGRVRDLLSASASRRGRTPLPCSEGRLKVDRLTYFPPGVDRPVLKSVSFEIEPGEVLGIIGPSGAGKSTLARLIVGVWEPTSGGAYLDGNSTFLWERESFGRFIGYVPQSVALIDGTVGENIARMGEADPAAVVRAARMAGVHDMIGRLPFGYDTPVSDGSYVLSGGQRQRIALARALFGMPRLLVLDEPNSNLDHVGEEALLTAIGQAKAAGTTVIMVAHRPSIISVADKLLVLNEGAVERFGARTEVMRTVLPGGGAPVARLVKTGDQR